MQIFALLLGEPSRKGEAISALQDESDREPLPLPKQLEFAEGWQDRQPEFLDPEKVRGARSKEARRLRELGVHQRTLAKAWDGEAIDSRWVDKIKGDGTYRSRITGRDFKKGRDDSQYSEGALLAGTADNTICRLQHSYAAEDKDLTRVIIDARSVYYQADALRNEDGSPQAMRPSRDVEPEAILWALVKGNDRNTGSQQKLAGSSMGSLHTERRFPSMPLGSVLLCEL